MENDEKRQFRWYEAAIVVVLVALVGLFVLSMNSHKVAVVDMDRVFRELGMPQKIEKDRLKLDAYIRGTSLLQAYNSRMSTLKERRDAAKTQADKDKFESQMKAAQEQFQESVAPLQGALQNYEMGVASTFRHRLQPFVAKVAQKRRVDVVMSAGPTLIHVRKKADITDDVVTASKSFFDKDMPMVDPALSSRPGARKEGATGR